MSQDPPGWLGPDDDHPGLAALEVLGAQHADLVAYCRSVTGREQVAVGIAGSVLDSAHAMLGDPYRLRAWLFALARTEIMAGSDPHPDEVLDLVHRHGIRPEDLAIVLGIPAMDADELLIAAEDMYGDRRDADDRADWDASSARSPDEIFEAQHAPLVAYCHALTGREDAAIDIADAVMGSVQSLLHDPEQLRAWLFALARREMLADAQPNAQEILDLVHGHGIRAEDLPVVLGIPAVEADELLAAAEQDYASRAFHSGYQDAIPGPGDGWPADRLGPDSRIRDEDAVWDEDQFWADDSGPVGHGPEPGGRHAAPGPGRGGPFARGPLRVAAAAGIVVGVIGVSTWYLAAANGPPASQASQQTRHHPTHTLPSPTSTPSPAPTTSPSPSATPAQPVTVVQQPPAPARTSPRTSPKPTPKPSPSPSRSPSPSPSSPSPSASSPSPTKT